MKDLSLLALMTQLGLSVALPLAAFILLAVWLRERFGWGQWVLWAGIVLGMLCAVDGLVHLLKTMSCLAAKKEPDEKPPVSYNDHD